MLRVPEVFVPAQPQKPTPGSARRGASGAGKQSSEDQGPEDAASQQDIGTPAGTGGTSAGAGGAGGEHPEAADQQADDGDDPRRVAHELLGQAHAVLVIATRDGVIEYWCPEDLRGSFLDARDPLWIAIGNAEVEIGSGEHDAGLRQAGIGGRVSRHKRRGLRKALERLTGVVTTGNARLIRAWLKSAAGLARTAVGSMVREIPGGEIIAEALDGILAGIDTTEALEITQSTEQ